MTIFIDSQKNVNFRFWWRYLQMVQILLLFVRAQREGKRKGGRKGEGEKVKTGRTKGKGKERRKREGKGEGGILCSCDFSFAHRKKPWYVTTTVVAVFRQRKTAMLLAHVK